VKRRPLVVLTGARGGGKTYACVAAARKAAELGYRIGGFVSRSERDARGVPTSIRIEEIVTGESRLLARRGARLGGPSWPPSPSRPGGPEPFGFSPSTLAWAIELAARALASGPDLVVVDEIGPVELELGEGLFPLLAAIAARAPETAALVTVRPSLASRLAAAIRCASAGAGAAAGAGEAAIDRESRIVDLEAAPREKRAESLIENLFPL